MTVTRESAATRTPAPSASSQPEHTSRDVTASLRGLSYAEQVQALSPRPTSEVSASDIPGTLYSNTSKTNLNKTADWPARLGFALATEYQAQVTFRDLVLAGRNILAPPARAVGPVTVPPGSNTADAREYDFIGTPTGSVHEAGINRFPLRGGATGNDQPVTLRFANNGGLNLARLARSAYELAMAKGVVIAGDRIDWKGQTFALSCAVQMGNAVDAKDARAYGFVGEFDLRWIQEKVSSTIDALAMTTALAGGRGKVQESRPDAQRWMHPYYPGAEHLQTPAWEPTQTAGGRTVNARKSGVDPIAANSFRHPAVKAWGETSAGQKAWVQDPAELAARAQRRLAGAWAPGADWHGHPTYITECPDFGDILDQCFQESSGTYQTQAQVAAHVLSAVQAIGARLQLAPMQHELIDDPAHQQRLEMANKRVIAQAFASVTVGQIEAAIAELAKPRRTPVLKPSDAPVTGDAPNDEGLLVLRDWSSRDRP